MTDGLCVQTKERSCLPLGHAGGWVYERISEHLRPAMDARVLTTFTPARALTRRRGRESRPGTRLRNVSRHSV